MKTIEEINQSNVKKIISERKHPDFFPGDIVKVGVRITEGKRDRIQYFEGVCIAKKNRDINSSFTVRKISFGEGVERVFPIFSPTIDSISVVRTGQVRRAKLYYLRDLTGKKARIVERIRKKQPDLASLYIDENEEVLEEEYLQEDTESSEELKSQESVSEESATDEPKEEESSPETSDTETKNDTPEESKE